MPGLVFSFSNFERLLAWIHRLTAHTHTFALSVLVTSVVFLSTHSKFLIAFRGEALKLVTHSLSMAMCGPHDNQDNTATGARGTLQTRHFQPHTLLLRSATSEFQRQSRNQSSCGRIACGRTNFRPAFFSAPQTMRQQSALQKSKHNRETGYFWNLGEGHFGTGGVVMYCPDRVDRESAQYEIRAYCECHEHVPSSGR